MFESLVKRIFKDVKNIDYTDTVERTAWEDAMWMYGNDKPDIRFEIKLCNLKKPSTVFINKNDHAGLISGVDFKVFDEAETVIAIAIPGAGEYTRKQTDELTEWVKRPQIGMKGLVFIKCNADGTFKSSVDKFYTEEKLKAIAEASNAKAGDLILVLAGAKKKEQEKQLATCGCIWQTAWDCVRRLNLNCYGFWIFLCLNMRKMTTAGLPAAALFTSPKPDHISVMINNNPVITDAANYLAHPYAGIKANAYDLVLNGNEIGGGSIRIHQRELQEKMFAALGMDEAEQQHKFGFLLGAFEYGAPPHGGIAFGFDRLCAIIGGSEIIRDFIAFPKNNSGRDVMLDAPGPIDDKQFEELQIKLDLKKD